MIYEIDKNIWFDANKLNIITGEDNYQSYLNNQKGYLDAKLPQEKSKKSINVVFLSSTACNLRCSYCYAGQGTYHGVSELNTLTAQNYIKAFETLIKIHGKIETIGFFGGEPLLGFSEIKKFVEYIYNNYGQDQIPYFSISSNGTIMNVEIKDFMQKYSINLGTSLDGPKYLNDVFRNGEGIQSVYDEVSSTLNILSGIPNIKRAMQFTFSRIHLKDYQSGDAIKWAKELEALPITWYEIIAASSDDPLSKIDLNDEKIRTNFEIMCNELADHCLNCLITQETTVMPNIFVAIILLIAKRMKTSTCTAGYNITITPDLRIYPCHIIANDRTKGVDLSENYLKDIEENECFQQMKALERKDIMECESCIAFNICGVFCKGMVLENNFQLQTERCLLMKLFLKKVISFMAIEYREHADKIKESIIKINKLHQLR